MFKLILINVFLTLFLLKSFCQTPHISGEVNIDLDKGLIFCDLKISNLPNISGYSLWLNSGMNIQSIKDSSGNNNFYYERFYNDEQSYEAFQYFIPNNDGTKRYLPHAIKIKYTGAFPVFSDTSECSNGSDWKGNIAFNTNYLRASEQSAWYPIVYDTLKDEIIDKYTYDIRIVNNRNSSVFINGSQPKIGKDVTFKSLVPCPLLIFSGNFNFSQTDSIYFLNTDLNKLQQNNISSKVESITKYYENHLHIPYGSNIYLIGANAVSKNQSWMFVTYPSIVNVGNSQYNLKNYFKENTGLIKDSSILSFFSHELAHYYFGTYFKPNSNLKWILLEGFTEYLSLQYIRDSLGNAYYNDKLRNYLSSVSLSNFTLISKVKNKSQIDENYRYNYIPLLLTAIEKKIGREKMWNWLTIILKSNNNITNYAFLKQTLKQTSISISDFNFIEYNYFNSPNSKKLVIESCKRTITNQN